MLFIDGLVHFTDGKPSERMMGKFRSREDKQIMSLEAPLSCLALCEIVRRLNRVLRCRCLRSR